MRDKELLRIALRYRAIYLDIDPKEIDLETKPTPAVLAFVARLRENGFSVNEDLLHALCMVSATELADITAVIDDVMGVELNWATLVKGWNVPTGETRADHLITFFANLIGGAKAGLEGCTLPCGCFIPEGTFPLERYTGCPFCGTPFTTANFVYKGQASKLKELRLFTEEDLKQVYHSLLASPTPLDATQKDSFEKLIDIYGLPDNVEISMKETAMLAVKHLVANGQQAQAQALLKTPTDILRYLWYEKTGYVQIIEPRTLIAQARRFYFDMFGPLDESKYIFGPLDQSEYAGKEMKEKLKLKYNRKHCQCVASWINNLALSPQQATENMNAKRGMWVRMIRALRLGEYSRRKGYEHLADILDAFYRQEQPTWLGILQQARNNRDTQTVLQMLKQRPGLFARSLFATMLRFGCEETMEAFEQVTDQMPSRLLLSLGNAAEKYFDPDATRTVHPITGYTISISKNKLLSLYSPADLRAMVARVKQCYILSLKHSFAAQATKARTIYIAPSLFDIPISVGDRSATIQDTSCALMGTRFPVEGDAVRLFLQWGKGLHAQPLDMDISCHIAFENGKTEDCAYYRLKATGAKHGGDIRAIPEMVGTAEYIELSLPELAEAGAKYVTFTANAYSCGALSPNLVVGWMNSAYPMKVSEKTGVAYDPSCVQHMVRISESNLSRGLVFGVLDVDEREITWLEMPFIFQNIQGCDFTAVNALLQRLRNKLSIGQLLEIKAEAQHLSLAPSPDEADEAYTYEWALNPAEVSALLNM
ncbi:hypothetical protein [Prevotellamassilia timonensis]|uniref:hypothetical protein n=1 Tax=Prevotellamassilia timonensis TaxID=1852370 RepID=UPI00307C52C4